MSYPTTQRGSPRAPHTWVSPLIMMESELGEEVRRGGAVFPSALWHLACLPRMKSSTSSSPASTPPLSTPPRPVPIPAGHWVHRLGAASPFLLPCGSVFRWHLAGHSHHPLSLILPTSLCSDESRRTLSLPPPQPWGGLREKGRMHSFSVFAACPPPQRTRTSELCSLAALPVDCPPRHPINRQ